MILLYFKHSLDACVYATEKKNVIGSFFLVNDKHIRCLIAWDYTFIRALAEGRFSLADRHSVCSTVIHAAVVNIPGI